MEINIGRQIHLRSEVLATRPAVRPLTDQEAATIAAGWQSSGTIGMPFATLASTGRVSASELRASIIAELRDRNNAIEADDFRDLCDLYAWSRGASHEED